MSALVDVKDICKVYNPGENEVRALDHVSLSIEKGEFVAIIGQSGSGKSTLMNMLGCLDVPIVLNAVWCIYQSWQWVKRTGAHLTDLRKTYQKAVRSVKRRTESQSKGVEYQ